MLNSKVFSLDNIEEIEQIRKVREDLARLRKFIGEIIEKLDE